MITGEIRRTGCSNDFGSKISVFSLDVHYGFRVDNDDRASIRVNVEVLALKEKNNQKQKEVESVLKRSQETFRRKKKSDDAEQGRGVAV